MRTEHAWRKEYSYIKMVTIKEPVGKRPLGIPGLG